jgi:DNA-binding transcriptional regulator LsrR (DeoR family)
MFYVARCFLCGLQRRAANAARVVHFKEGMTAKELAKAMGLRVANLMHRLLAAGEVGTLP